MLAFYADHFVLPLPEGHRFPMSKYSRLRQRVAEQGLAELHVPEPVSDEAILRCHTPDYLHRVSNGLLSAAEQRRIGFPWSLQMVERCRRTCEERSAQLAPPYAMELPSTLQVAHTTPRAIMAKVTASSTTALSRPALCKLRGWYAASWSSTATFIRQRHSRHLPR